MTETAQKPLLLLINPRRQYRYHWDLKEICRVMGKRSASIPLALPLLAALTPKEWDVEIADEEIGPIRPSRTPTLVGITAMVSTVKRGFDIADEYRRAGVKVVMGGPEVSSGPERVEDHADALVVGEAEGVWDRLLDDALGGSLAARYQRDEPFEFNRSPQPRWDLVETSRYLSVGVQVSRGCPFHCDFCLVHKLFGGRQRYRDLDDVIAELEAAPLRQISFADDNLTADKAYARRMLERMIPLNLSWSCQASFDTAYDRELVRLMARAGCASMLLGFESLEEESLRQARKGHNILAKYDEAVRNLQEAGIQIVASFVVGFDADNPQTFERIRRYTLDHDISYVMVNALTAYPGTDFHARMEREERLAPIETNFVNGIYPTVEYAQFSRIEMFTGCFETLQKIYSYEDLSVKGPRLLGNGAFTEARDIGVSAAAKLRSIAYLLATHLLTFDRHKRRLFFALLKLVASGVIHAAQAIQYLLFVSSFRGYLRSTERYKAEIVEQLASTEACPRPASSVQTRPPQSGA